MEASREHPAIAQPEPLRLHIGGKQVKEGWKIVNIQPGEGVDVIGSCTDLRRIHGKSVEEVYASHVLEHLGHRSELSQALREILRVLRPGGLLRLSVPDLETLCRIFLHPTNTARGRLDVMTMMFGGQVDEFDFHKVGLTNEFMTTLLRQAGFIEIRRVKEFGLFDDHSKTKMGGVLISLNMEARRPE